MSITLGAPITLHKSNIFLYLKFTVSRSFFFKSTYVLVTQKSPSGSFPADRIFLTSPLSRIILASASIRSCSANLIISLFSGRKTLVIWSRLCSSIVSICMRILNLPLSFLNYICLEFDKRVIYLFIISLFVKRQKL